MKKLLLFLALLVCFAPQIHSQDNVPAKRVFFEALTNASCVPCANNDPLLQAFIDTKGDSIVTVKYHGNFPGFDPMYNDNPVQNSARYGTYYGMNASPWLNADGKAFHDIWPFSQQNLDNAFNTRKVIVPKVQIFVTDTRIAGDTIRTDIRVRVLENLTAGDYKLRVFAVEGFIDYGTPPGSNGVSLFKYVFKRAYPDVTGTTIPTTPGDYDFTIKYKREASWVDANIYTIAFVQNDAATNREVLNVTKAGENVTAIDPISSSNIPDKFSLYQNYPNPFNPSTNIKFDIPKASNVKLTVYNTLGKEVATLINEELSAGQYNMQWNGAGVSSGVYFYKLETDGMTEIRKMMLIK
jgi:hypothetical protein